MSEKHCRSVSMDGKITLDIYWDTSNIIVRAIVTLNGVIKSSVHYTIENRSPSPCVVSKDNADCSTIHLIFADDGESWISPVFLFTCRKHKIVAVRDSNGSTAQCTAIVD